DRDEVLAAVGAGPAELDLALTDDVQRVARLALAEEDVTALHAGRGPLGKTRLGIIAVQAREERRLAHNLVVHAHSVPERWVCAPWSSRPGDGADRHANCSGSAE